MGLRFDLYVRARRSRAEVISSSGNYRYGINEYRQLISECRGQVRGAPGLIADLTFSLAGTMAEGRTAYGEACDLVQNEMPGARHDPGIFAHGMQILGNIKRNTGDLQGALRCYRQALKAVSKAKYKLIRGGIYHNMGLAFISLGKFNDALRCFRTYRKIGVELDYLRAIGMAHSNMATVYWQSGQLEKALQNFKKGISIAERIGNKYAVGHCLIGMGIIHRRRGELDKALGYYQRSLAIARDMGNLIAISNLNSNIGVVHYYKGNFGEALKYYRLANKISLKVGDRIGEAQDLQNIANLFRERGDFSKAGEYCSRALSKLQKVNSPHALGVGYLSVARNYYACHSIKRASACLRRAKSIFTRMQSNVCRVETDTLDAEIMLEQNRIKQAFFLARRAYRQSLVEGVKEHEIQASYIYGRALAHEDPGRSLKYLNAAILETMRLGWWYDAARLLFGKAKVLAAMRRTRGALSTLKKSEEIYARLKLHCWTRQVRRLAGSLANRKG